MSSKLINIIVFNLCFFASISCTNYSSNTQLINSPVLLGIVVEDTGHIVTMAAQNTEIGFLGYRLYEGADENSVRAIPVANGIDCGPFETQAILPVEYTVEIKPGQIAVTPGQANRVCAFNASLTSGRVIGIRSVIFSLVAANTSEISNVLIVP